ncbi:hypothetical protein V1478_017413 [Vespula squamosa]|uniref:Uncharacterized protein n=1 Tax=Vespula squamosa TaxID=30214 RepID=A0ABD1ZXE5_VESSQ
MKISPALAAGEDVSGIDVTRCSTREALRWFSGLVRARRHTRRRDTLLLLLVHVVGGGHDHVLPIEEREERCQWRARGICDRSVDPETRVEQKEESDQEEEEEEERAGLSHVRRQPDEEEDAEEEEVEEDEPEEKRQRAAGSGACGGACGRERSELLGFYLCKHETLDTHGGDSPGCIGGYCRRKYLAAAYIGFGLTMFQTISPSSLRNIATCYCVLPRTVTSPLATVQESH